MAMGADDSFELISIATYAPQYIWHNKFFLGSVCQTYDHLEIISEDTINFQHILHSDNYFYHKTNLILDLRTKINTYCT